MAHFKKLSFYSGGSLWYLPVTGKPLYLFACERKDLKHIFNTNTELLQNRTEKQIMLFKTTVNCLFNDIWCYLVIVLIEKLVFFNTCKGFIVPLSFPEQKTSGGSDIRYIIKMVICFSWNFKLLFWKIRKLWSKCVFARFWNVMIFCNIFVHDHV